MIAYIHGELKVKNPTYVIIETAGIGYFINISLYTFQKLPSKGLVLLHTHLSIKEDAHTLYGFAEESEKNIFRQLISISGVGPGTARVMLSSASADEISDAIIQGDVSFLKAIKGIGAKTAQRIIVDLQDSLRKTREEAPVQLTVTNGKLNEAINALITLGFPAANAEKAVKLVAKQNGADVSIEDILKQALKIL
jgi:holliday junction DNA helicase RuvA